MDLFGMSQLTIPATDPDLVLPKRRVFPHRKLQEIVDVGGDVFFNTHADIL